MSRLRRQLKFRMPNAESSQTKLTFGASSTIRIILGLMCFISKGPLISVACLRGRVYSNILCIYGYCLSSCRKMSLFSLLVLSWMFISSVVELQRNFSIQSNSKIVVHDALFFETSEIRQREEENRHWCTKEVSLLIGSRLHMHDKKKH